MNEFNIPLYFRNSGKNRAYPIVMKCLLLICLFCLGFTLTTSCTMNSDCNNGICQEALCLCNKGFVSYGTNQTCNYQQKEKLTAFILSLLIGSTGADWFYLARGNGGNKQTKKFCKLIKYQV